MLARTLLVAVREVKAYIADRGDLLFSLLLPVAVLALMLGAFSGTNRFNGTGYFVDRDGGLYATALLDDLRQVPGLEVKLLSPADAARRLERSDILMYTEIPAGFSTNLAAGQPAELVRHQRGNGAEVDQIVAALVQDAAQRVTAQLRVQAGVTTILDGAGVTLPPEQVTAEVDRAVAAAQANPPVTVVTEASRERASLAETMFPNVAVMFIVFAITLNAQSLVQERRMGTLERLMSTRLSRDEFLLGKFIGNVLRGMIQLSLLFGLGAMVFDFFTWRSFLWSILFGFIVVAASSALGLVVAVIARTPDQAIWTAVFLTMTMTVFGGTFFQASAGSLFDKLARATLTYWANGGFQQIISQGAGLAALGAALAVMAGVIVVGLATSWLLFTRQIRRA